MWKKVISFLSPSEVGGFFKICSRKICGHYDLLQIIKLKNGKEVLSINNSIVHLNLPKCGQFPSRKTSHKEKFPQANYEGLKKSLLL